MLRYSLLAVTLIALTGCGGGGTQVDIVNLTGKVTFEGAAVTEGTVQFVDETAGMSSSAEIGAEGAYSVELPAGTFKITVTPPMVEVSEGPDSPPSEDYKEMDNIPEKYRQGTTTDLTVTVKESGQTHDIAMTK